MTVTPGTILNGGGFVSVVPSNASAMVDIRLMPSTSADEILKTIDNLIQNIIQNSTTSNWLSASVTIVTKLPAVSIDSTHPLVVSCVNAIQKIYNLTPTTNGCGPANEGYMLIENGIPTICGFGPIGGNVHGVDEWISLTSMSQTVDTYCDIVRNYCGLF